MHPLLVLTSRLRKPRVLPLGNAYYLGASNDGRNDLLSCGHLREREGQDLRDPYANTFRIMPCAACKKLLLGK